MTTERDKAIAEAVIEAAARKCEQRFSWNDDRRAQAKLDANEIRSLDLDAIIASVPEPEHVAFAVVSPKGDIHKLAIRRLSAERKAEAWKEEWPDNQCAVVPLCFAPTKGKP